ncbi:MAG TPA: mandelate racemase/muconate lactonizing enzyme family protein [Herpetosiphonaceae bacterium]|nr:mandelate racemase/muconate lactonizing enzyme family protein [Herpetosiphonaceae bacterium]
MKITDIQSYPVWNGSRHFFFVVVDTDEGVSGVGEGGITGRELAMAGAVEHFKQQLVGQDPQRISFLWQLMSRGGFFPAQGVVSAALSAIDIALWDIKGKSLGVPVYQLMGGLARDRVVCYPHNVGHSMDIDSLVESCLQTKEEGWKFVRWGLPAADPLFEPRRSMIAAIKQMEAVRAAVGDEIEMIFDVHTRLDLPDALVLCDQCEPFRPFFMEDPLRAENAHQYRILRQRTSVPLAAGEQFSSKWEFREVIEEDLIDYARVDVCIVGGLSEALKVAGWCETHHIKLALHNPLSPVSSAACLQLNLVCPNVAVQEQPRRTGTVLLDVVPVQPEWEDGYLLPSTRPGLGIEFDREAARAYGLQATSLPQLRRYDGSFTNW